MNGLPATATVLVHALVAARTHASSSVCDVAICPPAPLLYPLSGLLEGSTVWLGGQDCHYESCGAYTGEISPALLKSIGCRYVILGHSERRHYLKETSSLVKQKAEAAINAGLIPVICIGESEEERQSGRFMEVITTQLKESLPERATAETVVIAYEPVWAIGTGKVPQEHEIAAVHQAILKNLPERLRILYGGSVKPANTRAIMSIPFVDGLLVGGCSLNADDFLHIIQSASIEE